MTRKREKESVVYKITGITIWIIAFAVLFTIGYISERIDKVNAEEVTQPTRQFTRQEQVRIMQECYNDAARILKHTYKRADQVSMAKLFFIYRTGMAISNNLVQPELPPWNDE